MERDAIAAIREVIPSDRVRFRLSDRAAERGDITLAPVQWRTLLLVDGERDLAEIAARLPMPRLETQRLLAELVRAGLTDTIRPLVGDVAPAAEAAAGRVTLRGTMPDFPLETIVQLLAETAKTGLLEVRGDGEGSSLGMSEGRLVSAAWGEEHGELALGGVFTTREAEFEFVPSEEAPAADLAGDLDQLLDRAAETRDRILAIRELIPDERSRFVLSERASERSQIVLTPAEWRVLLGVNGQRNVAAIARHLRMRRVPALMALADLVRDGYVDVLPADAAAMEATGAEIEAAPVEAEATALETIEAAPEPVEAPPAPAEPAPPAWTWEPTATEEATPEAPAAEEAPAPAAEPTGPAAWGFGPPESAPAEAEEAAAEATAEAYVDPRLAMLGMPTAEPEAAEPEVAMPEAAAPSPEAAEIVPEETTAPAAEPPFAPPPAWEPPPAAGPAVPAKKGLFGLFGGAAPSAPAAPAAWTRSGQLAVFANELLDAYNSGRYGKGRVEDRMAGLLMRADEQADPVDRPLPVANDRLDVAAIDGGALPERQALPYLAVVVRQIHEDAERALGKDKARRAYRDVRDRVLGKDSAVLQAPEVSAHLPKV